MGVYVGYVQTVVNRLPVESVVDTTLSWMQSRKLLENPSTVQLAGFNEQSIDLWIQIVSRCACAYFLYPRIAPIFSLFNATVGIIHLGIGGIQRFKTTEAPKDAPEIWNNVALNIHKGFAHLFTAAYDFGIGFLLKRKYINLGGAAAFTLLPVLALLWHQRVFRKPEANPPTAAVQPELIDRIMDQGRNYFKSDAIEAARGFITEKLQPPPEATPPSEKVVPKYLVNTCLIYVFARRITLELMPNIEPKPPENLLTRTVKVVKRVSGVGLPEPIPDYGL